MSLYKVSLESIELFGYHGVLEEEKKQGQNFYIDIEYKYEKKDPGDKIEAALDYSAVYKEARKVFSAKNYDLLENLSKDIATAILATFSDTREVMVTTWKKNPPVGGQISAVGVSIKEKK